MNDLIPYKQILNYTKKSFLFDKQREINSLEVDIKDLNKFIKSLYRLSYKNKQEINDIISLLLCGINPKTNKVISIKGNLYKEICSELSKKYYTSFSKILIYIKRFDYDSFLSLCDNIHKNLHTIESKLEKLYDQLEQEKRDHVVAENKRAEKIEEINKVSKTYNDKVSIINKQIQDLKSSRFFIEFEDRKYYGKVRPRCLDDTCEEFDNCRYCLNGDRLKGLKRNITIPYKPIIEFVADSFQFKEQNRLNEVSCEIRDIEKIKSYSDKTELLSNLSILLNGKNPYTNRKIEIGGKSYDNIITKLEETFSVSLSVFLYKMRQYNIESPFYFVANIEKITDLSRKIETRDMLILKELTDRKEHKKKQDEEYEKIKPIILEREEYNKRVFEHNETIVKISNGSVTNCFYCLNGVNKDVLFKKTRKDFINECRNCRSMWPNSKYCECKYDIVGYKCYECKTVFKP